VPIGGLFPSAGSLHARLAHAKCLPGIRRVDPTHRRRGGRVAEGGGLLNRYTVNSRIVGSNPIPSANHLITKERWRQKRRKIPRRDQLFSTDCHRIATGMCPNRSSAVRALPNSPGILRMSGGHDPGGAAFCCGQGARQLCSERSREVHEQDRYHNSEKRDHL
jgi:hypothetical protein